MSLAVLLFALSAACLVLAGIGAIFDPKDPK